MDLFRRKQKLIFWIVAIIIIPSFVLVWGVDRFGAETPFADVSMGTVDGRDIKYPEFDKFQRRLGAALAGLPLHFAELPDAGTRAEDMSRYLFAYALLKDAEKAGFTASDSQVGTYLDNSHPAISPAIRKDDPQSRDRAVDGFCRQQQITRAELLQGIREWQTIGNYIDADNQLTAVNDEAAYAFYSLSRAEIVVKRIQFAESDELREQAKTEIMAMPEEEREAAARNYAAERTAELRYRTPSGWRFAWLLTPYVDASSVRQPSDAEIAEEYERGKNGDYAGKTPEQAREQVKAKLVRDEVERQTYRNVTVDVDPQLRAHTDLSPEELTRLTQLAKYRVVAGDTGGELLTPADVASKLPGGSGTEFTGVLEAIDKSADDFRDKIVADLKSGFNLGGRPYNSDEGMYRIHLLDYRPSAPAELDGPDGRLRPEIYETALSDMVGDRAAELALEGAQIMESQIREYMAAKEEGRETPDAEFAEEFDSLPTQVMAYLEISDSNYSMGLLPVGDILGPRAYVDSESGERGQELVVMTERRVPDRKAFASEPENVRDRFRQVALTNLRGSYGVTYTNVGPTAFINPGKSLLGGLLARYYSGGIRVNPSLLQGGEG